METSLTVSCSISFKYDDAQHYFYYFVYIREMANVSYMEGTLCGFYVVVFWSTFD